jgi:hypothetical protein
LAALSSRRHFFVATDVSGNRSTTQQLLFLHAAGKAREKWQGINTRMEERADRRGMNDDRSPLLDLMICIVCRSTMRLEKVDPNGEERSYPVPL